MPAEMDAFRGNFSAGESSQEHFLRCWAHSSCGGCLDSNECSWCPFVSVQFYSIRYIANIQTWACVPNSYKIPMLAPAYERSVCPHPAEQWELRTRPFGCRVSSTTSLTAIMAVVATVLAVLLVLLLVCGIRFVRRARAKRVSRRVAQDDDERRALLPQRQRGSFSEGA